MTRVHTFLLVACAVLAASRVRAQTGEAFYEALVVKAYNAPSEVVAAAAKLVP